MAFVSLVSSPPTPVLDKNMTDSEHAGHEREDGELEDGEIDDEGIGIEEEGKEIKVNESKEKEKEKEKEKDDKTHRHSRKRYKKTREKRRSKRRRRDRQKHHSPSSSSSSDSYDSDHERPEKPKNKKSQGSFRDYDGQSAQHGRDSNSGGHSNPQRTAQHKSSDFEKFSDYSDDKYDYEGEGEDFTDDLCEYRQAEESNSPSQGMGRQPKEQMKRPNMKGLQKQQQFSGQRGRGRGVVGRGRGMLNKNKKQKGKNWGRGRGRGGEQTAEGMKQEGKGPPGFQKRRPIMTKEFINQHTVEHNGRYICKYFLEGRCIKGEQCKFEHELVVPDKKKELCKFYIQGYCSKGDNCIYMHNEYPCKFFHTGAKCYQGDSCKFSHKPLTDVTKELLDKIINTEEENAHEDELELENLRKQGIAPLPKPPPGVGLLPTPGPSSPQDGSSGGKKIPSLFEIKVQPTVDLAQKIGLSGSNFSSPPGSQFQGEGPNCMFGGGPEDMQSGTMMPLGPDAPPVPLPGSPGSMGAPPPSHIGTPMRPSPPGQHPSHGFPMPPPVPPGLPPNFHGNRPNMNPQMKLQRPPFPPMPDLQMLQNRTFHAMGQNPVEFLNSFFRNQTIGQGADPSLVFMQESYQQGSTESQMQSLPPAVQRALFLHLNQQQGNESQGVEGQGAKTTNRVKDENTNWYSSDEEDGNCVTAILKSLKKQNEIFQGQQPQTKPSQPGSAAPAPFDPRLLKDRAPPSDPRMKTDPRQRPTDTRKEPDGTVDPRLVRDPRKVRPMEPHKPPTTEEDEDGEREPRERAALIPLDASPGVMLRDPRCQLKQFSHIRVDILLQRPVFAQTVVWAPEDLIPLLVPKQEHSINLPLPPLVANAQLNRTALPDHPPITTPPHIDPRLAANRLKEGVGRLPPRTLESRSSTERLLASDPRQHKTLDPRISRSGSLDSKFPVLREASSGGGAADPRLQRGNAGSSSHTTSVTSTTRPEPEKLPPYAPNLASSGGGLESPTTLLGGICLYDPRNKAAQAQKDEVEPPKKTGILKQPAKRENTPPSSLSPTQRTGSIQETKGTNSSLDGSSRQTPLSGPTVPSSSPIKPPAVHNLPIQALVGLIRPSYTDPRHPKLVGQDLEGPVEEETEEEPKEEMDDRPLKDVFKTFDPTASPFCQ